MAPHIGLHRKVEGLEDIAIQTVIDSADAALSVDMRTATPKELSELEDILRRVSKISLRDGRDSGSQERERERRLLQKLESSREGLAQALERLSVEQNVVDDETTMDLCDA